jgi:hypothetical protein
MTLEDLLARLIPSLERAKVPYMLTGSVASSAHGIPRSTRDIDIVIAPTRPQLVALLQEFPSDRYYADEQQALDALVHRSQFNIIDFASGWKADFIFAQETDYARTAFARRKRVDLPGASGVYVAAPEDVLLAKLQWAKRSESERQLQDAAGILRTQGNRLEMAYVESWVRKLQLEVEWERVRGGAA